MTHSAEQTQRTDRLTRLGRTTFIIGSVVFILIGALHTFVQLTDMSASGIRGPLEAIGKVENVDATAWELWAGLGLLMGFFAIALGASNLAGLFDRHGSGQPALGVCLVNIAMLISISTIGVLYLGPLQLAGGPIGGVLFGIPAIAAFKRPAG